MYGARISLLVGVTAMVVAALAGVFLGLLGGYYGKMVDAVIGRCLDALLAFPVVLLAIFIVAVLGPSMLNAIVAVAIVYTPTFARLARASVLSLRTQDFVEAARAMGASDARVLGRHVLPSTLSPLIVQCSLGIGSAILIEASLSFLGLGVQPPTPSWGAMIGAVRNVLTVAPWLSPPSPASPSSSRSSGSTCSGTGSGTCSTRGPDRARSAWTLPIWTRAPPPPGRDRVFDPDPLSPADAPVTKAAWAEVARANAPDTTPVPGGTPSRRGSSTACC